MRTMSTMVRRAVVRFIGVVALLAATPITVYSMTPQEEVSRLVADINMVRKGYQLEPLTVDHELAQVATIRAEELSTNYSHVRPDGTPWQTVSNGQSFGENIAKDFAEADDVFAAWMSPSDEKYNILNEDYRRVSVKTCIADDGKQYWVAEFGF